MKGVPPGSSSSSSLCQTNPFKTRCGEYSGHVFLIGTIALCIINGLGLHGYLSPLELGASNIAIMCGFSYSYIAISQRHVSRSLEKQAALNVNVMKSTVISLLAVATIIAINGTGIANLLSTETMAQLTFSLFAFSILTTVWYELQRKQLYDSDPIQIGVMHTNIEGKQQTFEFNPTAS